MMTRTILAILALAILSTPAFAKPPDAGGLTQDAVQTALAHYFADARHQNDLIHRSLFTPGIRHRVGDKFVTVTFRAEIEKGKRVAFVRVAEVTIRDIDSVPARLAVFVRLDTWAETGQNDIVPTHEFLTYELTLDSEANLVVTKERLESK